MSPRNPIDCPMWQPEVYLSEPNLLLASTFELVKNELERSAILTQTIFQNPRIDYTYNNFEQNLLMGSCCFKLPGRGDRAPCNWNTRVDPLLVMEIILQANPFLMLQFLGLSPFSRAKDTIYFLVDETLGWRFVIGCRFQQHRQLVTMSEKISLISNLRTISRAYEEAVAW